MECLFCNIVTGKINSTIIYKDERVVAFDDINPQAPHHKIIIPCKHIATVNDVHDEDIELIGYMVQTAAKLAKQLNFAQTGYRLVMNCNSHGCQTILHIHLHLIGGRQLAWPPG